LVKGEGMEKEANHQQVALAREEGLVVQEVSDEVLVYDLKRQKAHYLNKTAALIWNQCDGQKTVAEIATLLHQQTGMPVNEEMVWYGLDKLGQANLLDKRITPAVTGVTRRTLMRQLGQGALLAIPVIGSLVAPAAAQQASVVSIPGTSPGNCTNGPTFCAGLCCATGGNANKICIEVAGNRTCSGGPCAVIPGTKC
jgi:hypothetical protein